MSYCCGTEILYLKLWCGCFLCRAQNKVGSGKGFSGLVTYTSLQLEDLHGGLSCSRNHGSSAIWTVWFLNPYSSRSYKSLNFASLTEYILSLSPGEGQIAIWPSFLGMTFKLKLYYKFPPLYLSNNSKLRYSHKLTESLPLSLPSAPDGFYHLMKRDSFFPQVLSFIINFKLFWVQRDREVAQ